MLPWFTDFVGGQVEAMADLFQFSDDLLSDIDEFKPIAPTMVLEALVRELLDFIRHYVLLGPFLASFLLNILFIK